MAGVPRIPNAPDNYDSSYLEQVWRSLSSYFLASSTGVENGSANDYSTLPTTGYNLRVGQLYVEAGFVKVALSGVVYVRSFSLTSSLGRVVAS